MVSPRADLLADLDREAALRGSSRSRSRTALLALAAQPELQEDDPAEVDPALARARRYLPDAGSFSAADLVRAERDR